ncbi:MAG: orotidine-5'-phosphate decarboxylase [Acidimicrobiales bacterium]|nr:orotidine-5'-phosphate decarboxylase [Acidimicrobiales bacterium]
MADESTSAASESLIPSHIRDALCLVLDVDDLVAARRTATVLAPWFGTVKVGLELFSAAGPEAVTSFVEAGFRVFCDLKLHDIPNTVGSAARVLGSFGAHWVTVHTAGGEAMLRAAVESLADGASSVGLETSGILGVTVLTSEEIPGQKVLEQRCELAAETGCAGIVCAAPDLTFTDPWADRLVRVVPGIRMPDGDTHDQVRVASPRDALASGADLLVVGRAVTTAPDLEAAASKLMDHLVGSET